MTLDQLPLHQMARIATLDAARLGESASRRLRALGFEAGAQIESLRTGSVLAVRIGRTTIAIRASQAQSIGVEAA